MIQKTEKPEAGPNLKKETLLRELRDALGIREGPPLLPCLSKTTNATYRLETGDRSIYLGRIDDIADQDGIRRRIKANTGVEIPQFTAAEWDIVVNTILAICEPDNDWRKE